MANLLDAAIDRLSEAVVTEQMILAGLDALIEWEHRGDCQSLVRAVFLAMWAELSECERQAPTAV